VYLASYLLQRAAYRLSSSSEVISLGKLSSLRGTTLGLAIGLIGCMVSCSVDSEQVVEWRTYQGDPGRNQYSTLDQINRENVDHLEVVWIYQTGDQREDDRSQIQCNPIVVDGVLYATSPRLKVFALEAATGKELWSFEPFQGGAYSDSLGVNRGVVYWEAGDDRRIMYTAGQYLFALRAASGELIEDFGTQGKVDLRVGLDRENEGLFVSSTTPGAVYEDLLILGTRVSEGPGPAAPGHIRAYYVISGEIRWIFHSIPHPGEFGNETWPKGAWKTAGGANSWAGMSVDHSRGMVFIPTGSPAFDFWGGNRPGSNLFGNCVLALKADSGERVWHFQVVRHDLWDRDLPAPPNLVTVHRNGRPVDAVAQVTKSGHVFLFDRDSGEPLFEIDELPVPPSDLKGEEVWPTQPLPTKPPPFARQAFVESDITTIFPEAHEYVRERFEGIRTGQQFIPPSTEGTMIFPGFDGGGEWGGAAFDPTSGLLFINANEMPWILTMVDVAARARRQTSLGARVYSVNCGVCHGENGEGDQQNTYPPVAGLGDTYSTETMMQIIEQGKGFMPGFAFLPEAERQALVEFLFRGFKPESGASEETETFQGVPYTHTGYNRFLDQDGYPAVNPPWGTLNAIDLNSGELKWQVPLGEFNELTAQGIPPTGTENYGGPIVTAGGLVFIGASKDEKFRAFNSETGELLWETLLPAGGYATPATFEVNGRQYVVVAAGGGKMGTKSGDSYIAYALP